jgi:hypothetical protein
MKRLFHSILAFIVVSALTIVFAVPAFASAIPQPTYAAANVDGNYGEWNLTTDTQIPMIRASGNGGQTTQESTAYLRYADGIMYVLVIVDRGTGLAQGYETSAWAKIDGMNGTRYNGSTGDNNVAPDFQWIGLSNGGLNAQGYEASFPIVPGTYTMSIHIEVYDDGGPQSSGS